ncbi:hypothetical protein HD597_003676 [Nonomuraea thailandensis]|uniref:Lasso RiPP family leader peptide-containing protein n=1 Tax=Nonomuraea thailandensis TaxID=1188745 RepID=A0A9X2GJM6_9ACTN|nr:lasso RiPP family leader peptide-containing protein [Nonomuraea thailandensis]MCP2356656.1 hypothetical protein [Nonomuraea thailandensis]
MVGNESYEPPRMLDLGSFAELTCGSAGPYVDAFYYYG